MDAAAVILLAMALLAFTSTTLLHHQAQGAEAEYVLLELESLAPAAAPTSGLVSNSTSHLMCGSCKCCRKNSNPESCIRTCCYYKACDWSGCDLQFASRGCSDCGYPAGTE